MKRLYKKILTKVFVCKLALRAVKTANESKWRVAGISCHPFDDGSGFFLDVCRLPIGSPVADKRWYELYKAQRLKFNLDMSATYTDDDGNIQVFSSNQTAS